jgi:hypothetical protein
MDRFDAMRVFSRIVERRSSAGRRTIWVCRDRL